ncbi:MAG: RusA family crossover junction endodeoxyribonuclease, partial [Methanobacteriota archaeon]
LKPKSAPKRRRVWPDKRPDLDKQSRAVLDGLTNIFFADDCQVVELNATKDYGPPGVAIEIWRVVESEVASTP